MFVFPAISISPIGGTPASMGLVGVYSRNQFKSAPLQVGDFAVYFSNFPISTGPTGGSGQQWTAVPGGSYGYLAQKVLVSGDLGVSPTPREPTYNTDDVFIVYRGPSSLVFKAQGFNTSYVKSAKHCGTLLAMEKQSSGTLTPQTPATWALRRSQSVNWSGTSLNQIAVYDRMEPANTTYQDGQAIVTATTGSSQKAVFIYEFLYP